MISDILKDPDVRIALLPHPIDNEFLVSIERDRFLPVSQLLLTRYRARLSLMFANDERGRDGNFYITAVFALSKGDAFLFLRMAVDPETGSYPSLTSSCAAAHWYEREISDLFGLTPVGHPDPRRLILHEDWPPGVYPLRRDFDLRSLQPRVSGEYLFKRVEGEGIFEIPVGPVHAGVIEPGHFRFSSIGEVVFLLECRFGYKHRGLEKLAETLSIERLPSLAEQISGTSSVAHAAACCQAIEKAAGAHIPPAASRIRTILMELERLYNHIGDVGNLCAGTGLSYGSAQGALIKERLLQLNERITGSRFLRKMCRPGGVNRDITTVQREDLLRTLDDMERDFGYLTDFLMTSSSHLDRLETTGRLERKVAEDLGVVGVAARASGILMDTRLDHPYGEYGQISFKPALRAEGDVFARNAVRISEAASSLQILREVIQGMSPQSDELAMEIGEIEPYRSAIGYTETPRGETIHFLMTGPDRSVFRYKVRTPSYCNWPAVPFLFEGNIVPDFPLCNKSLNLSYAGIDL